MINLNLINLTGQYILLRFFLPIGSLPQAFSKSKRSLGSFELLEHLTDRNSTGNPVAINATANFFALKIVDSKHRVATPVLVVRRPEQGHPIFIELILTNRSSAFVLLSGISDPITAQKRVETCSKPLNQRNPHHRGAIRDS